MTAMNLERAGEIRDLIQELAVALALGVKDDPDELAFVQDAFRRSRVPKNDPAADVVTLCWHLLNYSGKKSVRVAAAGLGDLLLRPTNAFIVAHQRSDLTVATLNGVSIFSPNIDPGFPAEGLVRTLYEALDLSTDTLWDNLVYALRETELQS